LFNPIRYSNFFSAAYINNHTSVWGSWFDKSTAQWGYACCHSTLHISYCAGLAGIEATDASSAKQLLSSSLPPEASPSSSKAEPVKQNDKIEQNFSKKRVGEGDVSLDKEKLEQALREEKKRKAKAGYEDEERYSKKSKSGTVESSTHEVTEEQLGAFIWFLVWFLNADVVLQRPTE
jgi:pre-mRNA-processing factor SLU7